ncbi:hypothetical protein PSHT_15856 [Puccinia striiformis]|uniref:Uncharacterized protein n=1 Tax=Puccinia striiformis TaxID=27350 RepID=A0A2S4UCS7_9BASI|nr:hypothetical protein PSHT_15856 [Puccinia striiformis]
MNLLPLVVLLSCAITPAVLADGNGAKPDPAIKTKVVFKCSDAKELTAGWCVSNVPGSDKRSFVKANVVGPPKDLNYNCIDTNKENNMCCKADFKPDQKGEGSPGTDVCVIKGPVP